jgi:hypothetical protein
MAVTVNEKNRNNSLRKKNLLGEWLFIAMIFINLILQKYAVWAIYPKKKTFYFNYCRKK